MKNYTDFLKSNKLKLVNLIFIKILIINIHYNIHLSNDLRKHKLLILIGMKYTNNQVPKKTEKS